MHRPRNFGSKKPTSSDSRGKRTKRSNTISRPIGNKRPTGKPVTTDSNNPRPDATSVGYDFNPFPSSSSSSSSSFSSQTSSLEPVLPSGYARWFGDQGNESKIDDAIDDIKEELKTYGRRYFDRAASQRCLEVWLDYVLIGIAEGKFVNRHGGEDEVVVAIPNELIRAKSKLIDDVSAEAFFTHEAGKLEGKEVDEVVDDYYRNRIKNARRNARESLGHSTHDGYFIPSDIEFWSSGDYGVSYGSNSFLTFAAKGFPNKESCHEDIESIVELWMTVISTFPEFRPEMYTKSFVPLTQPGKNTPSLVNCLLVTEFPQLIDTGKFSGLVKNAPLLVVTRVLEDIRNYVDTSFGFNLPEKMLCHDLIFGKLGFADNLPLPPFFLSSLPTGFGLDAFNEARVSISTKMRKDSAMLPVKEAKSGFPMRLVESYVRNYVVRGDQYYGYYDSSRQPRDLKYLRYREFASSTEQYHRETLWDSLTRLINTIYEHQLSFVRILSEKKTIDISDLLLRDVLFACVLYHQIDVLKRRENGIDVSPVVSFPFQGYDGSNFLLSDTSSVIINRVAFALQQISEFANNDEIGGAFGGDDTSIIEEDIRTISFVFDLIFHVLPGFYWYEEGLYAKLAEVSDGDNQFFIGVRLTNIGRVYPECFKKVEGRFTEGEMARLIYEADLDVNTKDKEADRKREFRKKKRTTGPDVLPEAYVWERPGNEEWPIEVRSDERREDRYPDVKGKGKEKEEKKKEDYAPGTGNGTRSAEPISISDFGDLDYSEAFKDDDDGFGNIDIGYGNDSWPQVGEIGDYGGYPEDEGEPLGDLLSEYIQSELGAEGRAFEKDMSTDAVEIITETPVRELESPQGADMELVQKLVVTKIESDFGSGLFPFLLKSIASGKTSQNEIISQVIGEISQVLKQELGGDSKARDEKIRSVVGGVLSSMEAKERQSVEESKGKAPRRVYGRFSSARKKQSKSDGKSKKKTGFGRTVPILPYRSRVRTPLVEREPEGMKAEVIPGTPSSAYEYVSPVRAQQTELIKGEDSPPPSIDGEELVEHSGYGVDTEIESRPLPMDTGGQDKVSELSEEVKNLKAALEKTGGEKTRLSERLSVMERDVRQKNETNKELSEKLGVVEREKTKIAEGKKKYENELIKLKAGAHIAEQNLKNREVDLSKVKRENEKLVERNRRMQVEYNEEIRELQDEKTKLGMEIAKSGSHTTDIMRKKARLEEELRLNESKLSNVTKELEACRSLEAFSSRGGTRDSSGCQSPLGMLERAFTSESVPVLYGPMLMYVLGGQNISGFLPRSKNRGFAHKASLNLPTFYKFNDLMFWEIFGKLRGSVTEDESKLLSENFLKSIRVGLKSLFREGAISNDKHYAEWSGCEFVYSLVPGSQSVLLGEVYHTKSTKRVSSEVNRESIFKQPGDGVYPLSVIRQTRVLLSDATKSSGFVSGVSNTRDTGASLGVCLIEFLSYCYFAAFRVDVESKRDRALDSGKGKEKEGVDIDVSRGIFRKSYPVFNSDGFGFKHVDEWYYTFLDDGKLEKKFSRMLDRVLGLFPSRERSSSTGSFPGTFNDFSFVNVPTSGKHNNEYTSVESNVYENTVKLSALLNTVPGLKDFTTALMHMSSITGGSRRFTDAFSDPLTSSDPAVEETERYNARDYVRLSFFDKVYKLLTAVLEDRDAEDSYEDLNDLFDWFRFVKKNEDSDNGSPGTKRIKDMSRQRIAMRLVQKITTPPSGSLIPEKTVDEIDTGRNNRKEDVEYLYMTPVNHSYFKNELFGNATGVRDYTVDIGEGKETKGYGFDRQGNGLQQSLFAEIVNAFVMIRKNLELGYGSVGNTEGKNPREPVGPYGLKPGGPVIELTAGLIDKICCGVYTLLRNFLILEDISDVYNSFWNSGVGDVRRLEDPSGSVDAKINGIDQTLWVYKYYRGETTRGRDGRETSRMRIETNILDFLTHVRIIENFCTFSSEHVSRRFKGTETEKALFPGSAESTEIHDLMVSGYANERDKKLIMNEENEQRRTPFIGRTMDEPIPWIFSPYYLPAHKGVYDIGHRNSVSSGGFYHKIYRIGGGDSTPGTKVSGSIITANLSADLKEPRRPGDDTDERLGPDPVDEFKTKIEIRLPKLISFKTTDGGESVIYHEYNPREFDKVANGLRNENKVSAIQASGAIETGKEVSANNISIVPSVLSDGFILVESEHSGEDANGERMVVQMVTIILSWNYPAKSVTKKYGTVVYCRKHYPIVYRRSNVRKSSGEGSSSKSKEKEREDVSGEKRNAGYSDTTVIDVLKDARSGGDVFSFRVTNTEGMVKITSFSTLMEKCVGSGYAIPKRVPGTSSGKKDDVPNFEFPDPPFSSLHWPNKVGETVILGSHNVEVPSSSSRGLLSEEELSDERAVNVNEVITNLMIPYTSILLDIGNKGNSSTRKQFLKHHFITAPHVNNNDLHDLVIPAESTYLFACTRSENDIPDHVSRNLVDLFIVCLADPMDRSTKSGNGSSSSSSSRDYSGALPDFLFTNIRTGVSKLVKAQEIVLKRTGETRSSTSTPKRAEANKKEEREREEKRKRVEENVKREKLSRLGKMSFIAKAFENSRTIEEEDSGARTRQTARRPTPFQTPKSSSSSSEQGKRRKNREIEIERIVAKTKEFDPETNANGSKQRAYVISVSKLGALIGNDGPPRHMLIDLGPDFKKSRCSMRFPEFSAARDHQMLFVNSMWSNEIVSHGHYYNLARKRPDVGVESGVPMGGRKQGYPKLSEKVRPQKPMKILPLNIGSSFVGLHGTHGVDTGKQLESAFCLTLSDPDNVIDLVRHHFGTVINNHVSISHSGYSGVDKVYLETREGRRVEEEPAGAKSNSSSEVGKKKGPGRRSQRSVKYRPRAVTSVNLYPGMYSQGESVESMIDRRRQGRDTIGELNEGMLLEINMNKSNRVYELDPCFDPTIYLRGIPIEWAWWPIDSTMGMGAEKTDGYKSGVKVRDVGGEFRNRRFLRDFFYSPLKTRGINWAIGSMFTGGSDDRAGIKEEPGESYGDLSEAPVDVTSPSSGSGTSGSFIELVPKELRIVQNAQRLLHPGVDLVSCIIALCQKFELDCRIMKSVITDDFSEKLIGFYGEERIGPEKGYGYVDWRGRELFEHVHGSVLTRADMGNAGNKSTPELIAMEKLVTGMTDVVSVIIHGVTGVQTGHRLKRLFVVPDRRGDKYNEWKKTFEIKYDWRKNDGNATETVESFESKLRNAATDETGHERPVLCSVRTSNGGQALETLRVFLNVRSEFPLVEMRFEDAKDYFTLARILVYRLKLERFMDRSTDMNILRASVVHQLMNLGLMIH